MHNISMKSCNFLGINCFVSQNLWPSCPYIQKHIFWSFSVTNEEIEEVQVYGSSVNVEKQMNWEFNGRSKGANIKKISVNGNEMYWKQSQEYAISCCCYCSTSFFIFSLCGSVTTFANSSSDTSMNTQLTWFSSGEASSSASHRLSCIVASAAFCSEPKEGLCKEICWSALLFYFPAYIYAFFNTSLSGWDSS